MLYPFCVVVARCQPQRYNNLFFLLTFAAINYTNTSIYFTIMDHLPHEAAILVSAINMQLRDEEFSSLAELCYAFGTDPATVEHYLDEHGYIYNKVQKQFKER